MKEDKKWIQQVRKQLEDYSEPLPADLWEAIERDLDQSSVQPKLIPLWKRWQAVAAVVAVLVVSSTKYKQLRILVPGINISLSREALVPQSVPLMTLSSSLEAPLTPKEE